MVAFADQPKPHDCECRVCRDRGLLLAAKDEEIERAKHRLVRLQDLHRDEHLRAEKAEVERDALKAKLEASENHRKYQVEELQKRIHQYQHELDESERKLAALKEAARMVKGCNACTDDPCCEHGIYLDSLLKG